MERLRAALFFTILIPQAKRRSIMVGTKKYSDIIIPQIEFLGNDKLIAVSDQKLMLLEVSGKPQEKKEH